MSAGGFPSTSQDSETIVSKSASTDFGLVRKIGPSIDWKLFIKFSFVFFFFKENIPLTAYIECFTLFAFSDCIVYFTFNN